MRFSKALLTPIAAAALLLISAAGWPPHAPAADHREAPDFVLKSAGGSNIRLTEYRGEVVVLTFWASWCGDCRSQLETLADMHDIYRTAGLALLTVNLDREYRTVQKAAGDMQARFPVLHDAGGEVGRLYEADSLPTTVLIDRDGLVRHVFEGWRRGDEQRHIEAAQQLLREY